MTIPITEKRIPRLTSGISLTAARLAIAAVITYQCLLAALIFIRPELDPSWHTISEWALGRYGWIMVLAFLISAVSYGSLFIAIRSQVGGTAGLIGLGILLICTIGTVGVGVFPTDPMPLTAQKGLTTTGVLHVLFGSSAAVLLPLAALLINLNLARKNPAWSTVRRPLLWTAALPLFGFLGSLVHLSIFVIPLGEGAYGPGVPLGWPPRIVFLTYMVWSITLAWQAIKVKRQGHSDVSAVHFKAAA